MEKVQTLPSRVFSILRQLMLEMLVAFRSKIGKILVLTCIY